MGERADRDAFARSDAAVCVPAREYHHLAGRRTGLTQVDIPFEQLQDPEAIANWPITLSRDGTRTPMPWDGDQPDCGFTNSGHPWLPLGPDHAARAVNSQAHNAASMLNLTRQLLAFRNAHPALLVGTVRIIEATGDLLVFERSDEEHALLVCVFNLGRHPAAWSPVPARPLARSPICRRCQPHSLATFFGLRSPSHCINTD